MQLALSRWVQLSLFPILKFGANVLMEMNLPPAELEGGSFGITLVPGFFKFY